MGVAFCLVTPEVHERLKATQDLSVDPMTIFGEGLLHVRVEGPSVPDTGSWCKQVVLDDGVVSFKDDTDV
jgi:hypothetical protein